MGLLADAASSLPGATSGADVFEELRFAWEYLAAAMLFLSAQVPVRKHAVARGAGIVAVFSLLCLLYFPYMTFVVENRLPTVIIACWYLFLVFAMTFSLLWCFRISIPDLLWVAATAYAAQHVVYVLVHEMLALWLWPWLADRLPVYAALSVACCVVIYLGIYRLFASSFHRTAGALLKDEPHGVVTSALVFAMLFASSFGFQYLFQTEGNRASAVWMDLLVCGMLLGLQYTSYRAIVSGRETKATEQMLEDAAAHWELSHALLNRLGTFMHDVWHVALGVRVAKVPGLDGYIDRVEEELDSYRSTFYSRNDVLNSVLAAAQVLCRDRDIALTCSVGDVDTGTMPGTDLYALVDGMTRASIAAAASLMADPSRRAIDLGICRRADVLVISCDVACEAEQNPWSDAGALRALRLLAKKHGGALQATSENGVATLRASVPMTKPEQNGHGEVVSRTPRTTHGRG